MDTIKVGITHTGARAVVVPVPDGNLTVRPNAKLKDQAILPLTEAQIDVYKEKGVRFTGLPKTAKPTEAQKFEDLEEAVEVAKADHSEAQAAAARAGAGEAEKKALKEATEKLTAAEKALSDARK